MWFLTDVNKFTLVLTTAVLPIRLFVLVPWHFDTQQNSNQRSSASSFGFMTLLRKQWGPFTELHGVVQPKAQEDTMSPPGSSLNSQCPKQPINIPSSPWPWPADHSVYAEVKGRSMVALSVSARRGLAVVSRPALLWDHDTGLFCSHRASWSSVAKLMSFWKQLMQGSWCGQWAISLTGGTGRPLPSLTGGLLHW